ncbi:MAG: hypothetical protein Q8919_14480, partial [Bacteroidota bacterium]|nr:hypothetical protein [Bacteroidota bacterium]
MKRLTILLVSSLFVLIQSVSYCQHIPFGITRSELLERVRTMGGALRLAPHEGQIDTLKDVRSVDSIEMFGWKGNLDFLEGKNGKICMYGLTIKNASLSDFHKVSIAFAHEF